MEDRYFVQSPGGQRFGPADLPTLREWVAQGRIITATALVSETTREPMPAAVRAELFGESAAPPPVIAPTPMPPAVAPTPPAFLPPPAPRKSNTLAIVLVVLAGSVVCGGSILAAILFPVFAQAKKAAQRTQGLSGMKQLAVAVMIYQGDSDDRFPPHMESAQAFQPVVYPYTKDASLFRSRNPAGGEILGDRRLSGRHSIYVADPSRTIMLYDSLPWARGQGLVAHTDGSARVVPHASITSLLTHDPFEGLTLAQERQRDATAR